MAQVYQLITIAEDLMRRIMIFAKPAIAGYAKTRLIPGFGADGAAAIHDQLVQRTLKTVAATACDQAELWLAKESEHPGIRHWLSNFGGQHKQQCAGDLGARMLHAFNDDHCTGLTNTIVIGTDCPMLTPAVIEQAFSALEAGYQACVAPADDGGYVLLGLQQAHPALFTDMPWGQSTVMEQTRLRLQSINYQWQELPHHWDVDEPTDAQRAIQLGWLQHPADSTPHL